MSILGTWSRLFVVLLKPMTGSDNQYTVMQVDSAQIAWKSAWHQILDSQTFSERHIKANLGFTTFYQNVKTWKYAVKQSFNYLIWQILTGTTVEMLLPLFRLFNTWTHSHLFSDLTEIWSQIVQLPENFVTDPQLPEFRQLPENLHHWIWLVGSGMYMPFVENTWKLGNLHEQVLHSDWLSRV